MEQSPSLYQDFEILINELNERTVDYYGNGTFMGFKHRMDSFLSNFKSEYYKNLTTLNKENKNSYVNFLKNEIGNLTVYFQFSDERYKSVLGKFKIDETELFSHEKNENELYNILKNELSTLKGLYKSYNNNKDVSYDEIVDILRIFYNQFSHRYYIEMLNLVNGNVPQILTNNEVSLKSVDKAKSRKTFGFGNDTVELLRKIYFELKFESGDFINKQETPIQDFIGILTAKDFSDTEGKIHCGCETTQAAHILTAMKRYSGKLTFKNIEDSQKFFSAKGGVLTASNLSKSKSKTKAKKPKEFEKIEVFFANLVLSK
jgi:hypothetical protein